MSVAKWLGQRLEEQLREWLKQRQSASQSLNQRLQDPYYRFQSAGELHLAAALGVRLDVNQASVDDWLRLPGLSIHQARLLVTLNQSGVQFHCMEDIAAALGLPVQRLQQLAPVLQFCYYDRNSLDAIEPVNLNTASLEQIIQRTNLDPALAEKIVRNRQQQGSYQSWLDLQQRLQLSGQVLAELLHYSRFD